MSTQELAQASQFPQAPQAPADQGLAIGLLAEWLNLELGLDKGIVTPARVSAWLDTRTESQRSDLRQVLAWWIERRAVQ